VDLRGKAGGTAALPFNVSIERLRQLWGTGREELEWKAPETARKRGEKASLRDTFICGSGEGGVGKGGLNYRGIRIQISSRKGRLTSLDGRRGAHNGGLYSRSARPPSTARREKGDGGGCARLWCRREQSNSVGKGTQLQDRTSNALESDIYPDKRPSPALNRRRGNKPRAPTLLLAGRT